jgi:hypothetical protein
MIKFFLILFLISCTAFKVEDPKSGEEFLLKETKKINFCRSKGFQLIGTSSSEVKDFGTYLKKDNTLSTIEKFALWALFQMNIHPDSSSPNSKVQILVSQNNNLSYFEYDDKKFGSTPLLDGLNDFLGKTNQKNTLSDLAKILDNNFAQPVPIGSEFANFLKENREAIQKVPEFKAHFFKANHLIIEKETLPNLNFSDLVNKRKNQFSFNSTLFSDSLNETSIVCNKKLSLAKDFIGPKGYSNHFGIREGDTIILGVTTLNPDTSGSFEGTFLFKEKDRNFRPIICSFKKGDSQILFVSDKDKGPGQHLYHLGEKNLLSKTFLEDFEKELSGFRYITLRNPKRIILESRRATNQELVYFLNSKVPVYSVPSLGNIWGFVSLPSEEGFLKDPRNESYLFCD